MRSTLATRKPLRVFITVLVGLCVAEGEAKEPTLEGDGENINVGGERPFDEVNIFGDFGKSVQLPDEPENKIWWERMVRGEVGKDRFLILCALKGGDWKRLVDIRDYVEFQIRENYGARNMHKMLVLMAGKPNLAYTPSHPERVKVGEGWLEKNVETDFGGIESEWRIAPSVLPLIYFLLMGCPVDDRCK